MRIFVDTNVLFDVFAQREPYRESSSKIIAMQVFGDAELWAAPQSYLDIFYVLSKANQPDALQSALHASLQKVNLCATEHEDVSAALLAGWDDAEDALIGVLCGKVGADYLLTRDERQAGFKSLGIPAMTPEGFFSCLEREQGIVYEGIPA